eukprot:750180-Hanusia_phi.AAC.12
MKFEIYLKFIFEYEKPAKFDRKHLELVHAKGPARNNKSDEFAEISLRRCAQTEGSQDSRRGD